MYNILVSEVMLQQTQVDRVMPYYAAFLKRFPTARVLADAPLSDVLKVWQGLGYNRRAKMLHMAAKELVIRPYTTIEDIESLPGVGSYTARAVAAFAYNQDCIVIETNIRTAIIHHFYSLTQQVSDESVERILKKLLPKGRAREWYSALMDYGAYLKRSGISYTRQSKTFTKQKKFAGSLREARGAIVKTLTKRSISQTELEGLLGVSRCKQVRTALVALVAEGLVQKKKSTYTLVD